MFIYLIRKYLWILVLSVLVILVGTLGILGHEQSQLFAISLIGLVVVYLSMILRPNKKDYAKNGEKWIKKYTYVSTSESTHSHKDGSFETYYTHKFHVSCTTASKKYTYEYDILKNGGVSGKDSLGKPYSKKISEKLFLHNIDVLKNEKN
ncbi:MAG: hypothetical protein K6G28_02300 [Acholeplasmatales bacterium]|nr:hypothetical protein [Acholeplasmatales bacterium]